MPVVLVLVGFAAGVLATTGVWILLAAQPAPTHAQLAHAVAGHDRAAAVIEARRWRRSSAPWATVR